MKIYSIILTLMLLIACQKSAMTEAAETPKVEAEKHQGPQKAHADESAHEELPTKVHLLPQVLAAANIQTQPVQAKVLPTTRDVIGSIVADPDRSAVVTVRINGQLTDVRFKEGDFVKAGTILAVIESGDLARARAAYTSARARAAVARQNAERIAKIAEKGLVSGQELDLAKAESISLDADSVAAAQTLAAFGEDAFTSSPSTNAARMTMRAPIEGYVLHRNAVLGQMVTSQTVIAEIARFDQAFFLARLFEQDIANVTIGGVVEVRLNAYPNDVFTGKIENIGKQIDESARTVTARILVKDHKDRLKAGLFGSARITMAAPKEQSPRLVIPLSAITKIGDQEVVFVRQADNDFDVHPVTLGTSAEGLVEVLSGLREAEIVVVDGAFTLKSAVLKSTFGEEE